MAFLRTPMIFLITSLLPLSSTFTLVDPEYNKNVRPREGERPDEVKIGLFINSIRTVSEVDMVAVLDVFVQAKWRDERLNKTWLDLYRSIHGYDYKECDTKAACYKTIVMGTNFAEQIWKPDFYFKTAVSIEPTDDKNDNVATIFFRDGTVLYSSRYILTNSCPMELTHFPFDRHSCKIGIGSYKYHMAILHLAFDPDLTGMYKGQSTANFQFLDFNFGRDYSNISTVYWGKDFIEHDIQIHMRRKFGIYLLTIYLPNSSFWVNFWIDPKSTPERAGLTITLALAQIVLITGVEQNFPSVSDFKMVDIYLIVNFLFNISSLVETVMASVVTKNVPTSLKKKSSTSNVNQMSLVSTSFHNPREKYLKRREEVFEFTYTTDDQLNNEEKEVEVDIEPTNPVDSWSRVGFPLAFVIWNISFFTLTLRVTEETR